MIKRILILCILVAVSIYLIVAVTIFNRKPENQVCKGMELVVKDSVDYGFITEAEVTKLLKQKNLYPEKKRNWHNQCPPVRGSAVTASFHQQS